MKKNIVLLLSIMVTSGAFAFEDYATINSVEPQYKNINQPRQVCVNEIVQERIQPQSDHNYGGAILGTIAGGILGNQIGGGDGKSIATAIGAATGALIGDNMANRGNIQQEQQIITKEVRNCHMEDSVSQVLTGYRIEYNYNGKTLGYTAQQKPNGNRMKIDVQISPILY